MKFVISNNDCDKILEEVAEKTAAMLSDCVDQLSTQNGNQAALAGTTSKIATCLAILKFIRDD